jgi:hypothetical protein
MKNIAHINSTLVTLDQLLPQVEDDMWDFYLSMKNIAHTCSTLDGMFN